MQAGRVKGRSSDREVETEVMLIHVSEVWEMSDIEEALVTPEQ